MTIIAKLRLVNNKNQNEVQLEHLLDIGSNIIGRGSPSFINDTHISRKHAEIVISKELSQATYTQLGQNQGKLVRVVLNKSTGENHTNTIKISKGLSVVLKNGDEIMLYENGITIQVILEDDMMEPMETNLDDECATQIDSFDTENNYQNEDQSADDNEDQTEIITKQKLLEDNNNTFVNNSILVNTTVKSQSLKRERDEEYNYSIKKNRADYNNNNSGSGNNNNKLPDTSISENNKNTSPVYVQDDTRINLQEDELVYIKRLGHGSCGEVSLYEWRGTQVAVKIIFRSLIHKEKNGEFEKETAILKCLRHPNVVLFMGTCLLKGNLAIITEYLNRGSLRHVLNATNNISWNTKIKMCLDIAQGMNYLHTYNPKIIHRDLKSVNLLVDNNYNVKVSDFGLSRFTDGNDRAKTFCGTLPWIAPEVFGGVGYTTKADIFSFGIVLWEILTHKTPTNNVSNTEAGHPEIPSTCPIPFAQLIKECCSKNPENRPTFQQIIGRLKAMFVITTEENLNSKNQKETNNDNPSNIRKSDEILEKQALFKWRIETSEISDMKVISHTETYTVYSGVYKQQHVSIKQMRTSVQDFEKKELDILANLKSPYILKFYGVIYNENEYAIVTEYSPNNTLLSLMKDKDQKFSWDRTLDLSIQVAKSINELHHFNPTILHRGISSESFIFDVNNNIKITDFGLSRFNTHENNMSLGQIKGKFIYSPPELFCSKKFSTKSDVYSFSIVLWELINRCITNNYQVPFANLKLDYDFQIIHQTSKYKKRPQLDEINTPQLLVQLIKQCWDENPEDRPDLDKVISAIEIIKSKLVA